ncbi:MAG: metallophosphoesterase family protein [Candidatus Heimdallarchaeota archaeon]
MAVKILHTADLHLSKKKPYTLAALDEILKVAKKNKVDILTIGGDLFDKKDDAEDLRVELRNKFSKNDFKIVAIPGNHDADVYREGFDFGENFIPMTDEPFGNYSLENINLVAIPYLDELNQDMLEKLKNETKTGKTNVLLIHCTLDIGFSSSDFGEEKKYCPISKSKLEKLGYEYILAGHFHTKTNIVKLNEKSVFIYPGSPSSITTKELGKRKVVLLDLEKNEVKKISLKTFYYNRLTETVIADKEDEAISNIKKWLKKENIYDKNIKVTVNGFINRNETEYRKAICEINENVDFTYNCKDVSLILNDPLIVKFLGKLEESDYKNKREIEDLVLEVASKIFSQG